MPETNPLYEPDPDDERYVRIKRSNIDALESAANKSSENEARAVKAEREVAFARAGISLTDPKLAYFVKGYDGDLTSEAIKAAATEAGFLASEAPQTTVTPEQQTSAEAAARVTAAAAGAQPPTNSADRQQKYEQAMQHAMETGDWTAFDQTVAQFGAVAGINSPL